jgi:biotin transporter BioY
MKGDMMLSIFAMRMRAFTVRDRRVALRRAISARRLLVVLPALMLGVAVAVVTAAAGHVELLHRMPIFSGAQAIGGVTEFLDNIKGYLLSIVLAGFTVAGIAVGAAKLTGHSRANDMLFNVGVGVAIFAALPTLVA